jgi:Cdc6-like AAA superfamily ATPase
MTDEEKCNLFRDGLINYINQPFESWDNFRPLDHYSLRTTMGEDDESTGFRTACDRLFGWIGLNNSKTENVEAIKNTYVLSEKSKNLPSQTGFTRLVDVLISNERSVIYLKGSRGSGKTSALNFVFTENSAKIDQSGHTYFRCDARKLPEVDNCIAALTESLNEAADHITKETKGRFSSGVTLLEYINAHNIYVALMHSREDQWLEHFKVSDDPDDEKRFGSFDRFLAERSYHEEKILWREIVQSFLAGCKFESETDKLISGPDMTQFLAQTVTSVFRSSKVALNLVANFHTIIGLQKNYKGTILTIDGCDNFSRIEPQTRNYYVNLIKQLRMFRETDKQGNRYKSVILVFRPETMREYLQELVVGPKNIGVHTFTVDAVSVAEIMHKKHKAATQEHSLSHYDYVRKIQNSIFQKFLIEFDAFIKVYSTILAAEIRRHLPVVDSKAEDSNLILDVLFQNNVRSMQKNIVGCYLSCYKAFEIERSFTNHASLPVWCRSRVWPVLEGSVLVGERVMADDGSSSTPIRRGRWCPPLFSYRKESEDTHNWNGLGLYRTLQYISARKSATEKEAVGTITRLGYSDEDVLWCFNRALMYGLIEVDDKVLMPKSIPFRLTAKGVYFHKSAFTNSSLLYYQAAANLFPMTFHESSTDVYLHDETQFIDRGFFQASLSVGIAVFRCMHYAHELEMRRLLDSSPSKNVINYFAIPNVERCLRQWTKIFGILLSRFPASKIEKREYFKSGLLDTLISDIPI